MKICNACGKAKPYSEFNRDAEVHDGYRRTCKICRKNKIPANPEITHTTRKRKYSITGPRTCSKCKTEKSLTEFPPDKKHSTSGHLSASRFCLDCGPGAVNLNTSYGTKTAIVYGASKILSVEERAHMNRLFKYGLTNETFEALVKASNGQCGICTRPLGEKFCIDHDHDTGKVRGLLCTGCNTGLGLLGDNLEGLQRAINYLNR